MDQRSFWIVDAAGAPRKLCRPPMTSPEPGRMLAFAPFQGFIRGMSGYIPLTLWRHMTNSMIMIFRRSSALLYHRSISLFDIMLAKFALEFIATSGAFLAVLGNAEFGRRGWRYHGFRPSFCRLPDDGMAAVSSASNIAAATKYSEHLNDLFSRFSIFLFRYRAHLLW